MAWLQTDVTTPSYGDTNTAGIQMCVFAILHGDTGHDRSANRHAYATLWWHWDMAGMQTGVPLPHGCVGTFRYVNRWTCTATWQCRDMADAPTGIPMPPCGIIKTC